MRSSHHAHCTHSPSPGLKNDGRSERPGSGHGEGPAGGDHGGWAATQTAVAHVPRLLAARPLVDLADARPTGHGRPRAPPFPFLHVLHVLFSHGFSIHCRWQDLAIPAARGRQPPCTTLCPPPPSASSPRMEPVGARIAGLIVPTNNRRLLASRVPTIIKQSQTAPPRTQVAAPRHRRRGLAASTSPRATGTSRATHLPPRRLICRSQCRAPRPVTI